MSTPLGLWPIEHSPFASAWSAARRGDVRGASARGEGAAAPEGWRERIPTLYPKYVSGGFAPHHEEVWDWADEITADSSPLPFVLVLARGGGKSTTAELIATDLGVSGRRRYVLYVRETQEMADKSVGNVGSMLESDAVARHYPEHADKAVNKHGASRGWRRNRLVTSGGFVVDALGLDTAARGVKMDEQRPDLIIWDDIDGKHDTPATTAKKIATLTTSILPAGARNVAVLAIQNLIIPDGVFTRMVDGRADYLARRIVSGPHPAVRGLTWEYQEQGGDRPRLAVVTGGTPTWEGQNLSVIQHQIDNWGIDAFLKEAQHQVQDRREGLVLNFDPARHVRTLSDEEARAIVAQGQAFAGIDFGRWRFGFTLRAADYQGRVHQIAEYFSQDEDLEHRARVIHCLCAHYGALDWRDPGGTPWLDRRTHAARAGGSASRVISRLRIHGDSANPTDIAEINRAFKRIGSPLVVTPVGRDGKMLAASVERINNELGRNALLYRDDVLEYSHAAVQQQWKVLGYDRQQIDGATINVPAPDLRRWYLGRSSVSRGIEMTGSRLRWENEHWGYPVPQPGQAQVQVPDDDTADGYDMGDADRYALMSWWKPPVEEREEEKAPHTDYALGKLLDRLNDAQDATRGKKRGLVRKGGG